VLSRPPPPSLPRPLFTAPRPGQNFKLGPPGAGKAPWAGLWPSGQHWFHRPKLISTQNVEGRNFLPLAKGPGRVFARNAAVCGPPGGFLPTREKTFRAMPVLWRGSGGKIWSGVTRLGLRVVFCAQGARNFTTDGFTPDEIPAPVNCGIL